MSSPKTRIKVNRALLIEKIREREAQAKADYRAALAEYEKDSKAYPKAVADYLSGLSKRVRSGELEPGEALRTTWGRDDDAPSAPRKPSSPRDYSQVISQLEIAAEDTITITGEDFAQYMR